MNNENCLPQYILEHFNDSQVIIDPFIHFNLQTKRYIIKCLYYFNLENIKT